MFLATPVLGYCCPIWSHRHRKDIDKLEKIQRSAARLVINSNRPWRGKEPGNVPSMLSELEWESLEARRKRRSLVSFSKAGKQFFETPEMYHPKTKPPGPTRRVNTRQFSLLPAEILAFSKTFTPRPWAIPLWNSLSETMVVDPSREVFQKRLASIQL